MVFTKKAKVLTAVALAAAVGLGGFGIYRATAANPRTVKFVDITAESGDLVAQDTEVVASGVIEDNVQLNTITLTDKDGNPTTHTWANDFVMFMVDKKRGVVREIKDTDLLNTLGLPATQTELTVFYLTNTDKADATKIPAAGTKTDSDGDVMKWFISNKKLIAVGESAKLELTADATATAAALKNKWANYTNEDNRYLNGGEILEDYGNFTADGWGIKPETTTGQEKTLAKDEYYPADGFVANPDKYTINMNARDEGIMAGYNIVQTEVPAGLPAAKNTTATDLPWATAANVDKLAEVEEFYLGSDLEVSGNASYMFNITTPGTTYASAYWWTRVAASAFENLKDIYLYADMSSVSRTTGMFARCHNLENIYATTAGADFKNVSTAAYMFYGDSKLKSVSGTNEGEKSIFDVMDFSGTTGILKDTAFMFAGCETMEEPAVKNFDMSGVTSGTGMFYGARNAKLTFEDPAKGHYIGNWDLSSLVDGVYMFLGSPLGVDDKDDDPADTVGGLNVLANEADYTLTADDFGTVIVGNVDLWKMPALESMSFMFAYNDGITGVTFANDTGGAAYTALKEMSEAFLCDQALETVVMDGNAVVAFPALKFAQFAFAGCGGDDGSAVLTLTADTLETTAMMFYDSTFKDISFAGSSDLIGLTDASGMFAESGTLETVDLSSQSFTALTKGKMMFFNDTKLKTVTEPNNGFDFSALTDGSYMFTNDGALSTLKTSKWHIGTPVAGTDIHNMFQNSGITEISLASAGDNLTDVSFAFSSCNKLTKFTGPTNMTKLTNAFGMLADNELLKTATLTNSAPAALVDVRGAFANCPVLSEVTPGALVSAGALYVSNIFKNDPSIQEIDISKFDTTNATYMDGMFDGDTKLKAVTLGTNSLVPSSSLTLGALFRNCNLTDASLKDILTKLADSDTVRDMYAMFEGNKEITEADVSGMDFSGVRELSRIFYGCNKLGVLDESTAATTDFTTSKKITVPADFGGACEADNAVNMFYVVSDSKGTVLDAAKPSDDVLSCVLVDGTEYPALLKAYNWSGDNRKFALITKQTINGKAGTTHKFDGPDDATLAVDAVTSLLVKDAGTAVSSPLTYAWTDRLSSETDETALAEADNDYIATAAQYGNGKSYVVTAKVKPQGLTNIKEEKAVFVLNATPTGITATYEGDPVPVGKDFDKDDVEVKITLPDGSKVVIPSSGWSVPSTKVKDVGDNTYTITYKDGATDYTATITVPGIRVIGAIETVYTGPAVTVGEDYDTDYLETTAYYADDTNHTQGFTVTPNYYSGKKVKVVGNNSYTATYLDPANKNNPLTSSFTVPGYKEISRIDAVYNGPKIEVGKDYATSDVVVTVYYADGTGSNTVADFTVDSTTVKAEGDNSYIATWRNPFGVSYTAGFTVPGYVKAADEEKKDDPDPTGGTPADPTTPADVSDVFPGYAPVPSQTATSTTNTTATSTGVVQTGNEGKTALYIIAIIALVTMMVVLLVKKKRSENDDF